MPFARIGTWSYKGHQTLEKLISLTVVAAPLYVPSCLGWAQPRAKTLHGTAGVDHLGRKDFKKRVGYNTQSAMQ